MLQRLETRPQHVRQDDVASVLRSFRSRAAALLRRVSCRSAADVVQPSRRAGSPPLPRCSSVDQFRSSTSRRHYDDAGPSHARPSLQEMPPPVRPGRSSDFGIPASSMPPPRPQVRHVNCLAYHAVHIVLNLRFIPYLNLRYVNSHSRCTIPKEPMRSQTFPTCRQGTTWRLHRVGDSTLLRAHRSQGTHSTQVSIV